MAEGIKNKIAKGMGFWAWVLLAVLFRIVLVYSPSAFIFSYRPEVSTPLTSIRRLMEGYWLKKSSESPYAGSVYHGSPLLIPLLGPLAMKRFLGQPDHILFSLLLVIADVVSAMFIRGIDHHLQAANKKNMKSLKISNLLTNSETSGNVAALVYLWNPLAIVACVGLSLSPLENLMIIISLYGACKRLIILTSLGWVVATHLSLYPVILIIPVIILLGYGTDSPPQKLFHRTKLSKMEGKLPSDRTEKTKLDYELLHSNPFAWNSVMMFLFWASFFAVQLLILCRVCVARCSSLSEVYKSTYGFILSVEDLTPNIGVLWYFFAEVFPFFRSFFLIVFHMNVLVMLLPLVIRINHRPCFLAFTYVAIASMFKAYPSVGDPALHLSLLFLFLNELSDMKFSFFIFCGHVGVFLLSPIMHNLWLWRVSLFLSTLHYFTTGEPQATPCNGSCTNYLLSGPSNHHLDGPKYTNNLGNLSMGTGNANFYFSTAVLYVCLQIILLVESISAVLNHDRKLRKLCATC